MVSTVALTGSKAGGRAFYPLDLFKPQRWQTAALRHMSQIAGADQRAETQELCDPLAFGLVAMLVSPWEFRFLASNCCVCAGSADPCLVVCAEQHRGHRPALPHRK